MMFTDVHLVLAWFGFISLMLLVKTPFLITRRRKGPL
jgi:hypothetical protein